MLTVEQVMVKNPVTVSPEDSMRVVNEKMETGHFRQLPVVEKGQLVGIISDRDVRRATNSPYVLRERWYDAMILDEIKVASVMTPNPITVEFDAPLAEAVQLLYSHKIGGLPVTQARLLVGIITETDLLHVLLQLLEKVKS